MKERRNDNVVINRYALLFLYIFLCLGLTAQNSNNSKPIRFLPDGCTVDRSAYHTSTIIKHRIPYKLKLEPSYADKWVSWEIKKDTVIIDVKEYENGSVRDCKLVAYSNDGKYKDTFTIKEEIKNRLVDRCIKPIYFPSQGIFLDTKSFRQNIYIRATIPFSIKLDPSSASKWITYKVNGDSIIIDVKENNASEGRECKILAISPDKKYSDYYKVNQKGTSLNYSTSKTIEKSKTNSNKSRSTYNSRIINSSTSSVQCHGRTKSGARCSRRVADGGIYCWQHRK